MTTRDFLKVVFLSSLISSAVIFFFLRWPSPPEAQAVNGASSTSVAALGAGVPSDVPMNEDERINIRVYDELRRSVVNIISTTLEYGWFMQPQANRGVGSGFIVDQEGHIVTNYHVVEDAKALDVTLWNKKTFEAKLIGVDRLNDLAVIKIDCPPDQCPPVRLGDSDHLRVGQKVLAIGNPFGLSLSLTTGVVSSLGRRIETQETYIDEVIQTDAAINPGNSGGPLLDAGGNVVGINTLIYSRSGDSAGIGFAVPVNRLSRVLPDLIEHGQVNRPWMGLRAVTLLPELAEALELPISQGLLIRDIEPGSSLDLAGLKGGNRRVRWRRYTLVIGGDVLYSIDGTVLRNERDLLASIENKRPGDTAAIVYYRDGQKMSKEIELVGRKSTRRQRRL